MISKTTSVAPPPTQNIRQRRLCTAGAHRHRPQEQIAHVRPHPSARVLLLAGPPVQSVAGTPSTLPPDPVGHAGCRGRGGRHGRVSEFGRLCGGASAVQFGVERMCEMGESVGHCMLTVSAVFQLKTDDSNDDTSLLAYDCFHMSQKGHA